MPIKYKNVSYIYGDETCGTYVALQNINLDIIENSFNAIIGETGSGKTTLLQHLNALLIPSEGELIVNDKIIKANEKPKNLKELRSKVGYVFQFPEYQLFEDTIIKDVIFGPKNFGYSEEEALELAKESLSLVGLDETYYEKSPFELSGGQKRRVAIAGVLATKPDILILDEPTAGLDPQGMKDMMELFKKIQKDNNITVIMVTHNLEHVLNYTDNVIVMKKASIYKTLSTKEFFNDEKLLQELNLELPSVVNLRNKLLKAGFNLTADNLDLNKLIDEIVKEVKHG